MSPKSRGIRAWLAALGAALTLAAGACGDDEQPLRIGVVVDCVGINRSFENGALSGAQLPLIERGARPLGRLARDGITDVEVGGRPVELVTGCTEVWEFSALARELRRLVELEDVDAVVAAGIGPDAVVMRDVARDHPEVVFLPVVHGAREATLRRPARNIFRFAADYGQGMAGLASYAYRRLGWRRAAVVLGNWDSGWQSRDAFMAEFCALGGRVSAQIALEPLEGAGRVSEVPRDVDGVAVLAAQFFRPAEFINQLARRVADPARELVVGPGVVDEPDLLRATARALAGVAASSYVDPPRMREYLRAYARAFPGSSVAIARHELVSGYRDAMEALLRALEGADGSTKRLPAELAGLRIDLLGGPVRLDDSRQAVAATSLVRIEQGTAGSAQPALVPMDRVENVDQSVGGLLSDSLSPSDEPANCTRGGSPPPWAGQIGTR
jgi:branched-chain amino acid transport system substrate-binding protein